MVLLLSIVLAFILSAAARRCGASRGVAFAIPTVPALAILVYFVIRHDIGDALAPLIVH